MDLQDFGGDGSRGKILIVDDEPFNVSGLKIMVQCLTAKLQGFNFEEMVLSACNGEHALAKVRQVYEAGDRFQLVLMDCNMPKMDGYQATQGIRAFIEERGLVQPQIVALTGHSEEKYIQRAFDSGMNDFVKKPCKLGDLEKVFLANFGV